MIIMISCQLLSLNMHFKEYALGFIILFLSNSTS